jgi:glucose uptake protein
VLIFSRPSETVETKITAAKGDLMILPHLYGTALALTILTMLCWGSWANSLKFAKGWRFELLYYDYSIGVALAAALAGLSFGTWGRDGIGFTSDLAQAGNLNILSGFAGGVIFNLSNMLLIGAVSIAGMGVAFPIGVGLALVVGVVWNYAVKPQGNPWLLFLGVALIVAAILVDAIAYRIHAASQSLSGDKADAAAKQAATWKGIWLSIIAGVLMGTFYPLVEIGRTHGENVLGPYAVSFVFGLGVLASVFVYNLYFLRFPIAGPRLRFADYLKGNSWVHFLGIAGGMMWMIGSLSNFVAASVVGPAISYALGQGSTMVGALWGVLVWREFAGGGRRVNWLLALMFVLFVTGLSVVSIARS